MAYSTLARWHARLEFKPQDMWVGVFWKHGMKWRFDVWICIVPTLPIHIWRGHHP